MASVESEKVRVCEKEKKCFIQQFSSHWAIHLKMTKRSNKTRNTSDYDQFQRQCTGC